MTTPRTKNPSSRCQVCVHAECGTINLALARGAAVPLIATKFKGLSTFSLYRHFHNHISGPVLDRLRVRSLAGIVGRNINLAELTASENQSILAQIVALKASLLGAIQAAERADAGALMSSLVGRLTDLLSLEARLLGQITTGSQTTIHNYIASENFVLVRSALIAALRPFPDAARAVSRALLQIEAPKEIVDVESTQIGGGACEAETGAALSVNTEAPTILGAGGNASHPQAEASFSVSLRATSSAPPPVVIRLEPATDSITTVLRLER